MIEIPEFHSESECWSGDYCFASSDRELFIQHSWGYPHGPIGVTALEYAMRFSHCRLSGHVYMFWDSYHRWQMGYCERKLWPNADLIFRKDWEVVATGVDIDAKQSQRFFVFDEYEPFTFFVHDVDSDGNKTPFIHMGEALHCVVKRETRG